LEYTFKKVNQPGKLIRLCSYNEHNPDRVFDTSDISEIIKVPDYRTRWKKYTNDIDKDYGIANKIESLKYWVHNYPGLKDTDNVLLLDPDMVFVKPVKETTTPGKIIGQTWIGSTVEHRIFLENYKNKSRLTNKLFMYPYIITVGDIKKIVDTYASISYKLRSKYYPDLWEAEMFGLILATDIHNIDVETRDNLGFCLTWNYIDEFDTKESAESVSILHYTSTIQDKNNQKLFNKQDYTPHTLENVWKYIDVNKAHTRLQRKFLKILDEYNSQKNTKFYWENSEWIDSLSYYNKDKQQNKYIVFKPWPGGFNNIRMSLEIASSLAFLLKRTLVLPSEYRMYLLKNVNDFGTFFDINDLGIDTITFDEFKDKFQINTFEEVKNIATVIDDDIVQNILVTENIDVPTDRIFGRNIKNIHIHDNEQILYFPNNLLGSFYLNIFTQYQPELCKYVARHIHYNKEIFIQANKAIQILGDKDYYAIHIRRNDFQYKDITIPAEQIFDNIKEAVPLGSKLYISTDETDKSFFEIFEKHYKVFYFENVNHDIYVDLNVDLIGMVEQYICARAKTFIGTKLSTFSSYIYRLRGYMDDITDKRFLTYSIPCNSTDEEKFWWVASWAREYPEVWESINNVKYFSTEWENNIIDEKSTIFVSIASYRDEQLVETIDSLLDNASGENEIIIGTCMQDTEETYSLFKYKNHPNVKIEFVPYMESLGVGWARHKIQQELYTNEDYFLQIDSHSRVCKNWDTILIDQLHQCKTKKAILSTYPNGFKRTDIEKSYLKTDTCPTLTVDKLEKGKKIVPKGSKVVIENEPVLGFWIAAGFLFTYGEWTKEVIYSKELYFSGEEDHLSVTSYLNGWDVYVPPKSTVWHDYNDNRIQSKTKYRPLHWEDHTNHNLHKPEIIENLYSDKNIYVLERTIDKFYKLIKHISNYKEITDVSILFNWDKIPIHDITKDVLVIVFAFFDSQGNEIHRPDIYDKEIINRTKNILNFQIPTDIHNHIETCTWFVKYADNSFSERMTFKITKIKDVYII
jgi:hypothetical protein